MAELVELLVIVDGELEVAWHDVLAYEPGHVVGSLECV